MGYVVEENELMTNATGQEIAAAITANNNKANRSDIAPNFDIATSYSINDYVYYQSVLYRFTSAHSAGAWTGNDVEVVSLGTEIKNGVGKPKFVGSRSTWEGMPTSERKNYSEAIFPDEFEDETMAARNVSFDNTSTGMTATNTQNAITELKNGLTGLNSRLQVYAKGMYAGDGTFTITIPNDTSKRYFFAFGIKNLAPFYFAFSVNAEHDTVYINDNTITGVIVDKTTITISGIGNYSDVTVISPREFS